LHGRLPHYLLCGERGGLPPDGFDYGNSPAEFSRLDLGGRGAILATSNGTRVLSALTSAPSVLVGCLLDRTAVAGAAIGIAQQRGLDIAVICSAAYGGSTFVLEDALGAGAIIEAATRAHPALEAGDAARFARDAFVAASRDLPAAVASAYHAKELAEAGFDADVAYCARIDSSTITPAMEPGENGALALVAMSTRLPQT